MKKNLFLILLIFGSSIQAVTIRSLKKYATYLGCATAGCIATLLASQHKTTRPFFKKRLFPHYLQAHENLMNEVGALNQELTKTKQESRNTAQSLNLQLNSLKQRTAQEHLPLIKNLQEQLQDEREFRKDELCSILILQSIIHETQLRNLSAIIESLEKDIPPLTQANPRQNNNSDAISAENDLFSQIENLSIE